MDLHEYKQMFPSLTEEEIQTIYDEFKDDQDKLFDMLTAKNLRNEERLSVDPTLRKRFAALTMEEIEDATKQFKNRDVLISKLTDMEDIKKKKIQNNMSDFTMSVIGDVLTQSEGDLQETIRFLRNIQEEKAKDFVPVEQMDKDTRLKYVEDGIKSRAHEIVEEVKQRKEQSLIQKVEKKALEEEALNVKRIQQLEHEQGICILTIEYSTALGYVNLVWQFNKHYVFTGTEWFGLYKEDAGMNDYLTYFKVKSYEKGSYQFNLPKEHGFYHVRLVDSKSSLVTSNTIHIGPKVHIEAVLKEDEKKIVLYFNVEGGELSDSDWVSFTRKDKSNRKYISSHYLTSYSRGNSGIIEVNMPRRPLEYEFRYFPAACGYSPVKISNTIKVPKHDKLILEHIHNSLIDYKVKVTWDIHAVDVSKWDYIALYKEGETRILKSQYVNTKDNFLMFDIPRLPGNYVLKYWASGIGSAPLDTSEVIQVENKDGLYAEYADDAISVKWDIYSVDTSSKDWVAVVKVGKTNKEYFSYEYIRTCANHLVLTKVPKEPGTYEVRYFSSTKPKYEHLITSNPIFIP